MKRSLELLTGLLLACIAVVLAPFMAIKELIAYMSSFF
jgi:hypothetical protein